MSFLGDWLKQIIIIVLFAVFIDLLLPNRAMERYVRFVVSLLILLTLITPVVRIFTPEAKQKLEIALTDNLTNQDSRDTKQSTQAILRQGELLRQKQEAEALQWTAEEAARQMKQSIEQETGRPVSRVTVKLVNEDQDSHTRSSSNLPAQPKQLVYTAVEVVMASEGQAAENGEENRATEKIAVQSVDQVKIDVDLKSRTLADPSKSNLPDEQSKAVMAGKDNSVSDDSEAAAETLKKTSSGLEKQIEDLLGDRWGFPANQ
ncbi:stage III sporulation protein AF [Paenibacillus sp. D2_2]|uniref:stage III sporulation protein AF n=1 Tax=Paenibacillus sp. D2_2 TaxID=3073092 RepID=UPI002814A72B|nr:stage III sporulation protein AF [Paenibacillus sp. D2_2]WMT42613.1 stage III sporulation protein AF [Paenibacillus sp. D2_2]